MLKKIVQNRLFLHSLFWILSFYILLQHFSISSEVSLVDYIFTALFHVSIFTSVYINLYLLIPRFLDKQHYLIYIFSLAVLFVLFYGIHIFTFDVLSEVLFPGYYLITFYDYLELLKYFIIYIGLTTLFMLSKYWFELLESKKRLVESEKEKIQNELKALKAQVNPHFLFNSLNTIYSLALNNSKDTPSVILKLSNVLRYMIYESNERLVNFEKELEFILNYIELQKLRINNPGLVNFHIDGEVSDQQIAPLIFIVFIENAFKHGIKGAVKNQYVRIKMVVDEKEINFFIENNRGFGDEIEDNKYKGLGLENVKRRLELMYPNKHQLKIKSTDQAYIVTLKIKI